MGAARGTGASPHSEPADRGRLSRRAFTGIAGGAGLAMLAGCARGTDSVPAPPGVVTLIGDVATWNKGYAAASRALQHEVGYRLSPRSIAVPSNYEQFVRMASLTDSTTDLIKWWNGFRLQDLARGDVLSDLTAVWETAISQGRVSTTQRESFTYRGRQYAVPLTKSYYAMFYDKHLFAKLGLREPTSWDALMTVARRLRDAGVVPIQSPGAASWEALLWFQQLTAGLDPAYYTAVTTNRASYLDPTAREAMRIWSQMYADRLFSSADVSSADVPGLMQQNKFGMILYGTWFASTLLAAGFDANRIGLFLVPPVRASAGHPVFVESGALAVPVNAHKRAAAITVTGGWLTTPVQQQWVNFLGDTSPNPHAVPKVDFVQTLARRLARLHPTELTRYWEASPPALIEGNVQDLGAFMASPTPGAALSTLRSMQSRATKEWQAWAAA